MRLLIDTNIVLDVMLDRAPHAGVAAQVLSLVDSGRIDGALCGTSVTTIHYVAARTVGEKRAAALVKELLQIFEIAQVDRQTLMSAAGLGFADFEDAVIHEAASAWGASGIVTRDKTGFQQATLPVFNAHELLSALVAGGD